MKELLGEGHGVTLVAIDTDPNEDAEKVVGHIERHDLAGTFAVAPQEMTDMLVQQFGAEIITVPTAPVILLEADQSSARLLRRGVKDRDTLAAELR